MMEQINTISQFITTVGFPIFACVVMYWQMGKQSERHQEEMSKIQEALTNNTNALIELAALIKGGRNNG